MFGAHKFPVIFKLGTQQNQQVVRTVVSAHFSRNIAHLFDDIFQQIFLVLCRSFFYIKASSYISLVQGVLNSATSASAGEDSLINNNESRHVLKLNAPSFSEATLYVHSVRIVEMGHIDVELLSIFYKNWDLSCTCNQLLVLSVDSNKYRRLTGFICVFCSSVCILRQPRWQVEGA